MYLIVTSKNLIAEICSKPCYVRRQSNGVVILSDRDHADAIYSSDSDSFWPIEKIGYLCESHTFVEVDSVPAEVVPGYYYYSAGEFYTTEANLSKLAKDKAPELASLVFVSMASEGKFDDTTMLEHAEQFTKWKSGLAYVVGAICQHNAKLYRCLQAHTSQDDWSPDVSASLWKEVGDPSKEWPTWSQPIGAVDAYELGAKVSHNDKHWTSTAANNVWEPGVYGWEEVE